MCETVNKTTTQSTKFIEQKFFGRIYSIVNWRSFPFIYTIRVGVSTSGTYVGRKEPRKAAPYTSVYSLRMQFYYAEVASCFLGSTARGRYRLPRRPRHNYYERRASFQLRLRYIAALLSSTLDVVTVAARNTSFCVFFN